MCKLAVNDIIIVRFESWELKENKKYAVAAVEKDRRGNLCYYFKAARKNAVKLIKCYADDIDKEVNKASYKDIINNNLLLLVNRGNIFKWE